MRASLRSAKGELRDAAREVDQLHLELKSLVDGFGPALSPPQAAEAVKAFRQQHRAQYERLDRAAQAFSHALAAASEALALEDPATRSGFALVQLERAALAREARALLESEELVRFAQTGAGERAFGQAMEAAGRGETTFLDRLGQMSEGKRPIALAAIALTSTAGVAHEMASSGQSARLARLLLGMRRHGRLLGLSATQAKRLVSALSRVKVPFDPQSAESIRRANTAVQRVVKTFPRGDPRITALRGLTVAFSAAAVAHGVKGFTNDSLAGQLRTIVAGANLSTDLVQTVMSMMKLPPVAALRVGSPVLTSALNVITGVELLTQGKKGEASGSFMIAAGALALSAGAVGAVVGLPLILGGLGLMHFFADRGAQERERRAEENARAFLRGAGFSREAARLLADLDRQKRNTAPRVVQLARHLKVSPRLFADYLRGLKPVELGLVLATLQAVPGGRHAPIPTRGDAYAPLRFSKKASFSYWMSEGDLKALPRPPSDIDWNPISPRPFVFRHRRPFTMDGVVETLRDFGLKLPAPMADA